MHILFVHKNYPAQFGHIAARLVKQEGFQCTFLSERDPGTTAGVRRIQYRIRGGATGRTHYCSRSFENFTWHSHAVYEAMKAHPEVRPDLIVGHSGFGSTLFLPDLYSCPILNYFEYYYHPHGAETDFRAEYPAQELDILRCRTRNAMLLADLQTCTAGYCPTEWQRSLFPPEYQQKLETIFDGIDTTLWRRRPPSELGPRRIGSREIPADAKIVTYVSRGFELVRGFDVFMKMAKRICDLRSDVVFVCVGSDRVCYGGDQRQFGGKTLREHLLSQDDYDPDRFLFTGAVPRKELQRILNWSDLHVYLTVPFILSWSLMNALACGCTVLASDTAPVREMISPEVNGLLAPFHDVDGFVRQAMAVLDDPAAYRPLGEAAAEMIERQYSLPAVLPKMLALYRRTLGEARTLAPAPSPTHLVPPAETAARRTDDPGVRLLFAIPHYYGPAPGSIHGSSSGDPQARMAGLAHCITALHCLFGPAQCVLDHSRRAVLPASPSSPAKVDVVVCTSGEKHLLSGLALPAGSYSHRVADCDPMLLGFECHAALRDRLGDYDYYCYLEDDLVLHDPWFFMKLQWFTRQAGPQCLLQPNRYEIGRRPRVQKLYVDGDLPQRLTAQFQDIREQPQVVGAWQDIPVVFRRVLNPHSGCFFLNREQFAHWVSQPYFLDRDACFVGPLESAASLGILRTFRVYKPELRSASFLEIQHCGTGFINRVQRL